MSASLINLPLHRSDKRAENGLTLIELLISLSLLAIVLCFSLPLAPTLYKKNQLQLLSDELSGAIHFAKIQALVTGDVLALTRLPGTTDWSSGMMLFVDNAKHHYTPDVKLLHEWHWSFVGMDVSWHGFQSDDYLLFATDISHNTVNGYFLITTPLQPKVKLVVNRLGRIRRAS